MAKKELVNEHLTLSGGERRLSSVELQPKLEKVTPGGV